VITDELILRYLKGETSEAEKARLLDWLDESPENEERYRQIAKLWELRRLMEAALHLEAAPPASAILDRRLAATSIASRPGADVSPLPAAARASRRKPTTSRLRVAAVIALLLIGAGTLGYLTGRGGRMTLGSVQLMTDATEMSSARLADGSVVRLAPESSLQVEITSTTRRAWLHGRAFFAVQHDASRPFIIHTHAGEVVVRGTRFDLEVRSGDLQLLVVDGAVGLAAGGESVEVQAGQLSRVRDGGRPEVENVDDVFGELGWIGDFVAFEATPLREVVRELERRYGLRIQVQDSALAEQTVTSWSMNRSPQEILTAVCLALNAFCTINDTLTTIEYQSRTR
jgi:transmembrane sensor